MYVYVCMYMYVYLLIFLNPQLEGAETNRGVRPGPEPLVIEDSRLRKGLK